MISERGDPIGSLEMIRKAVVPPILGTKREFYKKKKKDFHLDKLNLMFGQGIHVS